MQFKNVLIFVEFIVFWLNYIFHDLIPTVFSTGTFVLTVNNNGMKDVVNSDKRTKNK